MIEDQALIDKYNQPGPRYTSYPTAPAWDDNFGAAEFREALTRSNTKPGPPPLSLYFHIPFCDSLCLYCGCNVVINRNHDVAVSYVDRLKHEVDWMSAEAAAGRPVEQVHWGGGTPTYLSAEQIEELFDYVRARFSIARGAEIGIEVDPRATNRQQCDVMRRLGFNRLSMGVQDFDPVVQQTVRRVQSYEMVKSLFDYCREIGFESINLDLIYGLPHQTMESFSATLDRIIDIAPDRIALFSYAHVPWLKKQQGSFARHLPEGVEKFRIFALAINKLTGAGYRYIGMDHFAKPDDELCRAQDERTLRRNFQGYTTKANCDLIGMGVSSISGLGDAYAQNRRDLAGYYSAIDSGKWPTMRGVRLSHDDCLRRSVISRILCHCLLVKSEIEAEFGIQFDEYFAPELDGLRELERDGLVQLDADCTRVVGLGRIFIRNVAMVFDSYLRSAAPSGNKAFSKTL